MKRLLALLLLSACAYPVATPTPMPMAACPAGEPAMTAQLFFGRTIKGGGAVTDTAWQDFLARSVTPRFPDGLTVLEASGQWRNRTTNQISREPSTILEIVTDESSDTLAKLQAIRADYRAAFQQDSVGLVVNQSCASF
jgi:hypothetical protein